MYLSRSNGVVHGRNAIRFRLQSKATCEARHPPDAGLLCIAGGSAVGEISVQMAQEVADRRFLTLAASDAHQLHVAANSGDEWAESFDCRS